MNHLVVTRRVQWGLLGLLILTLVVFSPLLLALLLGLTAAITIHPLYVRLYRYFQLSERSGRTQTFFAAFITLALSVSCLFLLVLPVFIIVDHRADIISAGNTLVRAINSLDSLDVGSIFDLGREADPSDASSTGPNPNERGPQAPDREDRLTPASGDSQAASATPTEPETRPADTRDRDADSSSGRDADPASGAAATPPRREVDPSGESETYPDAANGSDHEGEAPLQRFDRTKGGSTNQSLFPPPVVQASHAKTL